MQELTEKMGFAFKTIANYGATCKKCDLLRKNKQFSKKKSQSSNQKVIILSKSSFSFTTKIFKDALNGFEKFSSALYIKNLFSLTKYYFFRQPNKRQKEINKFIDKIETRLLIIKKNSIHNLIYIYFV